LTSGSELKNRLASSDKMMSAVPNARENFQKPPSRTCSMVNRNSENNAPLLKVRNAARLVLNPSAGENTPPEDDQ
jgi:hypothetical protein